MPDTWRDHVAGAGEFPSLRIIEFSRGRWRDVILRASGDQNLAVRQERRRVIGAGPHQAAGCAKRDRGLCDGLGEMTSGT